MGAGSELGYSTLQVTTLSAVMFALPQHNATRFGIATGNSLAEATMPRLPRPQPTNKGAAPRPRKDKEPRRARSPSHKGQPTQEAARTNTGP